jgi:hypothetical protein
VDIGLHHHSLIDPAHQGFRKALVCERVPTLQAAGSAAMMHERVSSLISPGCVAWRYNLTDGDAAGASRNVTLGLAAFNLMQVDVFTRNASALSTAIAEVSGASPPHCTTTDRPNHSVCLWCRLHFPVCSVTTA